MRRCFSLVVIAVAMLAFPCLLLLSSRAKAAEELKPIPAAEAEKQTALTRDFVLDRIAEQIDKYWHAGKWDQCIRLLHQNIEIDPTDTEAYTDLGWVLANLNRDAEAVAAYQSGIAANPKSFDIPHHFGMFYSRRKKYEQAIEQFRTAVRNGAPRMWQHMLPDTLEQAGRKQEALDEWRELLKRFPDDPMAKQRIKALEKALEKGQPA
jgi:tetratricopeptide (TPR) repeat protein